MLEYNIINKMHKIRDLVKRITPSNSAFNSPSQTPNNGRSRAGSLDNDEIGINIPGRNVIEGLVRRGYAMKHEVVPSDYNSNQVNVSIEERNRVLETNLRRAGFM